MMPPPITSSIQAPAGHIPVLLEEVVAALKLSDGGIYVDGTFGGGGYARAMLLASDCRVVGIDRDPDALKRGEVIQAEFPGRLTLVAGCFGQMDHLLQAQNIQAVDGVALDLGVSSFQLDEAERGFSFRFDGPLDMRMGRQGPSAADVVNETDEKSLADILFQLGEERQSRRIAKAIVLRRQEQRFERTLDLAQVIASVVKFDGRIHPATRSFQALRLYVNDELGELDRGLVAAESLLKPGGRLAVVSFHSLEDRRVKNFLKNRSGSDVEGSRHLPPQADQNKPTMRLIDRGGIAPSETEATQNPRSRSARLRVGERTDAPLMPPLMSVKAGRR